MNFFKSMFFFFKKHRKHNKSKGNKKGKSSVDSKQMAAISRSIINKKRLVVYAESM